ncbi:MAG: DUF2723 domain-containing protein [Phycisphaerae bacterium]|nr:DUF2723 domain-containing protein [Phycisphaerae bacterium]
MGSKPSHVDTTIRDATRGIDLAARAPRTEGPPIPAPRSTQRGTLEGDENAWPRLGLVDWLAILLTILVAVAITVPRLPPGICLGDSGGFQLAAATLGITHPPGYAGYVSIAHVVSWIPGLDPPLTVTLLCHLSGLAVLALCMMFQIRLGVHAFLAGALTLLLCAYVQIWTNLIKAEVYLPSLALMSASFYLLLRYAALGHRRDLLIAALVYGLVVANRPPAILALPFVLSAWWIARRRWETGGTSAVRTLLLLSLLAALPGIYSFAYYWVRDAKTTPYNYLDVLNAETHELPESSDGAQAKLRRVVWLARAEQFRYLMGNNWNGIRAKMRWLRLGLLDNSILDTFEANMLLLAPVPSGTVSLILILSLSTLGLVRTLRRNPAAAMLLLGMIFSSVAFVCYYRIAGDAADIRPLLFALIVLIGVGLTPVFPRTTRRFGAVAATIVFLLTVGVTFIDAPGRRWPGPRPDARPLLRDVNLASLPPDAVVFAAWPAATPLWYARLFITPRPDVTIINAQTYNWFAMFDPRFADRTFAAVPVAPEWPGYEWVPHGKILRLEPLAETGIGAP